MEEISSLDSFPTDGGDSLTRVGSATPKLDDENSEVTTINDKNATINDDKNVSNVPKDDKPVVNNNEEEDFEQISEGTFDVDDLSQGTSSEQQPEESSSNIQVMQNIEEQKQLNQLEDVINEQTAAVGTDEVNPIQQDDLRQEYDQQQNVKNNDENDAEQVQDKADEVDESTTHHVDEAALQSESFEEVDANVSTNTSGEQDEKNMLGEADNTLHLEEEEAEEEENLEKAQSNKDEEIQVMDVDDIENKEAELQAEQEVPAEIRPANTEVDIDDIEMGSPSDLTNKDVDAGVMEEEHLDEAMETGEEPAAETKAQNYEVHEKQADADGEAETETDNPHISQDVVDTVDDELASIQNEQSEKLTKSLNKKTAAKAPTEKEADDEQIAEHEANEQQTSNTHDTVEIDNSETGMAEDDDAEQEDEPVENVQEPEESDVCLIPDDTETQMTDAEKEQAILAREKAEKANEEAEEAEKAEKAAAKASSAAEKGIETIEGDEASNKDDSSVHGNDAEESTNTVSTTGAELPDPDEPLLEEMHPSTVGDAALTKIIISWTVTKKHHCKQCGKEKLCGFRFKNIDNPEKFDYLCGQTCCDALISSNPGKYFIRRKKFLLDELSMDKDDTNDASNYCIQCKEIETCKYYFKQDDDIFYICNDDCYNLLNAEEPDKYKLKRHSIRVRNIGSAAISTTTTAATTPSSSTTTASAKKTAAVESRVINRTAAEAEAARLERVASFQRRCADCFKEVTIGDKNLLWETMDFCNEICLGKYQRTIGATCQTCQGEVPNQALGKYCVRFGFDIRQFCCAACLNEYKKGLKTCSCCQKDISSGNEGFLAPVGDKEQFKDFCSQACMRRYDSMCNPKKKLRNDICAVCNNDKPVRVEIILEENEHTFCSNPCFSAFKFVSNIVADQCGMCTKYFERKGNEAYTVYTEHRVKVFCSRICLNVYIIVNRRIVSCQWCKVKKYNFDMIYKKQDTQEILMCSLNCLTLYGVSLNAFSRTATNCDNCSKLSTPQYHLTMSDASMRNFCTYQCVMQFQSQFARAPLTLDSDSVPSQQKLSAVSNTQSGGATGRNNAPFPTGLPKRVKLKQQSQQQQQSQAQGVKIKLPATKNAALSKKGPTVPVISAVSSLASGEMETMIGSVSVRRGGVRVRKMETSPPPPPTTQIAATVQTSNTNFARGRQRKAMSDYRQRSPTPPQATNPSSTNQSRGRTRKSVPDYRQDTPSPPISMSPPPSTARSNSNTSTNSKRNAGTSAQGHEKNSGAQTETKIVTVPPYPPTVRNVQTSCRPQTVTVGFQTEPKTADVGCQTSKDYSNKILIPVPVPIYIPQPMYMYSAPFPVPVPIPLPIPVPIFIPTTRNSAQGILKEIKKIQDKMPTDPLEAELLMMAEMVADDKQNSDSDSEDEIKPDPAVVNMQYTNSINQQPQQQQPQVEVANNAYGEDMLQMALKMATGEYDQPTVDLESAMTANTITNPPPGLVVAHDDAMGHMNVHHMQPTHQMLDSQRGGRGRKRGAIAAPASPRHSRSPVKRARLQDLDAQSQQQTQATQQQTQVMHLIEKPDANMCLKYTFGVNAWKQWVMTKNADIEKSSIRRRTFKTELLQMTADELNYSLCLFVKEVRKPNGTEYAPDTIYYLVLGIQQYLYENGRIDNIFTDPYYERFTDCLDEVARKFSVLYNDSQYIVTRVEEEHLWECKQLGAHSPHVLLSTLMFFNTKHFNLTTVEEHMQLSFSHIMKHWKRTAQNAKMPGTRNVLLRFYPPQAGLDANPRKKKVYEQQENEENPLRCPVRLYEFYLSKCPESVKTRNDVFYLQPERSCVPDSPVWYSTQALSKEALQKMLHRVKMVKEINIALLTS